MLFPYFLALLLTPVFVFADSLARYHGGVAAREVDFCGSNPVDCGGGWCCMSQQKCVKTSGDPVCADLLVTNSDGSPVTWDAYNSASDAASESALIASIFATQTASATATSTARQTSSASTPAATSTTIHVSAGSHAVTRGWLLSLVAAMAVAWVIAA